MSTSLPTVAVDRGGHKAIINQSDYDPNVDTIWADKPAPVKKQTDAIAPALALMNGSDVARDVAIIPTLGQAAAKLIIEQRPEGGYSSLDAVWESNPDVLTGRMKVDPDAVAAWGGEE